jgi:hypothetical protein
MISNQTVTQSFLSSRRVGRHTPARRLALSALVLPLLAACGENASVTVPESDFFQATGPQQGTFFGAAVRVGNGLARTYVTVSGGVTEEVGIALTETALQGLPPGPGHSDGTHAHYNEFQLSMHPQNPTPIQFVGLNWNADGHEPEPIYGVPHFDMHFYTISLAERNTIHPSNPQWEEKANNLPAPEFVPTDYVSTHVFIPGARPVDATVPLMGLHWTDINSPELFGEPFTETFIYGSWDGRMIFAEPMITKAFLETKPNFRRQLPQAQQGFTPGSYRIYWHEQRKEYRIALTDLPAQQ